MLDRFLSDGPYHPSPGYVVPFADFYRDFQTWLGNDLASIVLWHPNKVSRYLPIGSLPSGRRVIANYDGPDAMHFADRELVIWRGFVAPRDLDDAECEAISRVSHRRSNSTAA